MYNFGEDFNRYNNDCEWKFEQKRDTTKDNLEHRILELELKFEEMYFEQDATVIDLFEDEILTLKKENESLKVRNQRQYLTIQKLQEKLDMIGELSFRDCVYE